MSASFIRYEGLSLDDEAGLRQRYFENAPWRLEARVDLCQRATALGFGSIQLYHETCSLGNVTSREQACGVEVIICHSSCLALKNRKYRGACIPGLPLRTGYDLSLPCRCNRSLSILNCADTPGAKELPPVAAVLGRYDAGGMLKRHFKETMGQLQDCVCDGCKRGSTTIAG